MLSSFSVELRQMRTYPYLLPLLPHCSKLSTSKNSVAPIFSPFKSFKQNSSTLFFLFLFVWYQAPYISLIFSYLFNSLALGFLFSVISNTYSSRHVNKCQIFIFSVKLSSSKPISPSIWQFYLSILLWSHTQLSSHVK